MTHLRGGISEEKAHDSQLFALLQKYSQDQEDLTYISPEQALQRASALGQNADVASLITCVKNINAPDENPNSHRTALHAAAFHKRHTTFSLLLTFGANNCSEDANHQRPTQLGDDKTAVLYVSFLHSILKFDAVMILNFFSYLTYRELCSLNLVCHSVRHLANHDSLWKSAPQVNNKQQFQVRFSSGLNAKYARLVLDGSVTQKQFGRVARIFSSNKIKRISNLFETEGLLTAEQNYDYYGLYPKNQNVTSLLCVHGFISLKEKHISSKVASDIPNLNKLLTDNWLKAMRQHWITRAHLQTIFCSWYRHDVSAFFTDNALIAWEEKLISVEDATKIRSLQDLFSDSGLKILRLKLLTITEIKALDKEAKLNFVVRPNIVTALEAKLITFKELIKVDDFENLFVEEHGHSLSGP